MSKTRRSRWNCSKGWSVNTGLANGCILIFVQVHQKGALKGWLRFAAPQRIAPVTANVIDGGLVGKPFEMDLVIRPVTTIRPGVVMHPPIVLALKATTSESQGDIAYRDIGDVSGMWAFVSLISEDKSQSLSPPRSDLLMGSVANRIRPILDGSDPEDSIVGYAVFSDLAIAEPGTYRLKISLIDMDR